MTYQHSLFRIDPLTEPAPTLRLPRRCDGCTHYAELGRTESKLSGWGLGQCAKDGIATWRAPTSVCDHGEFIDAEA
jgi:hypothetical protein